MGDGIGEFVFILECVKTIKMQDGSVSLKATSEEQSVQKGLWEDVNSMNTHH